jgi:hypothetical protein
MHEETRRQDKRSKARFPLMLLGLLALLTALWGGLARLGWAFLLLYPPLPAVHGPLMVCGFLGTLIGVERAVALGALWPYAAPLLTAVGALCLLAGLPAPPLITLGSVGLVGIFAAIVRQQRALATFHPRQDHDAISSGLLYSSGAAPHVPPDAHGRRFNRLVARSAMGGDSSMPWQCSSSCSP